MADHEPSAQVLSRHSSGHDRKEKQATSVHLVEAGSVDHGETVELERNFSFLSCLGLAFALINSWTAMAASLQVVLPSGGSVAMVWGLIVSAVGSILMGLSLAECAHVFPLSGGQYDWTYCIAPTKMRKGLSYFVGWMACAAWTSLFATGASLCSNYIVAMIALWNPEFVPRPWQIFLLYLAFVLVPYLLNTFAVRYLPIVDRMAGIWGMVGIVVVCVTLLACSSGDFQSAKSVFATFNNETGWPSGVAFIMGLLQSTLGLTAFDAASHMVEEMPNPAKNAPKIMVLAIGLGAVTGWIFIVILLLSLRDWDGVLTAASGALIEIYYQSTKSRAGATCLILINVIAMLLSVQGVVTVGSRMIMAFSRDRGLGHVSVFFSPVHAKLKVPVFSLLFVSVWSVVFGLIYLGSTVAFNAILSVSLVFLQTSYAVPILVLFIRGDAAFGGHSRTWSLGRWRRVVNGGGLVFAIVTSMFFMFPPVVPVTGASVNYAVVVLAIVLIMCGVVWVTDGHKNFAGPRDVEDRLATNKNA